MSQDQRVVLECSARISQTVLGNAGHGQTKQQSVSPVLFIVADVVIDVVVAIVTLTSCTAEAQHCKVYCSSCNRSGRRPCKCDRDWPIPSRLHNDVPPNTQCCYDSNFRLETVTGRFDRGRDCAGTLPARQPLALAVATTRVVYPPWSKRTTRRFR